MVIVTLLSGLLLTSPAPASQQRGEILIGAVTLRTIGGKTSAELFPIAVLKGGKYRSAVAVPITDPPKPCALKAGAEFFLYRSAAPIGNMKVSKVVEKENAVNSARLGLGTWKVNPPFLPSAPLAILPGEKALAMSMFYSTDDKGIDAPSRVVLALNAKRTKGRGTEQVSMMRKRQVEQAMKPHVDRKAKKEKMPADVKLICMVALDVDGDGVREYAALFQDMGSDEGNTGIFVIGSIRNSKFELLYLEPDSKYYPAPFDTLDIDGDGVEELICEAGVYEGTGFMILKKSGGKFKQVFVATEFGL